MTSPLADEEELLRLVQEGLSQSRIAEAKGVSRQAVAQRLSALEPKLQARGLEVHRERQRRGQWVPWKLGTTHWRHHIAMKMLRQLGRRYEGPPLREDEARQLQAFLDKLDNMPKLPGGRGVVTYRGPDIGVRIVAREPWDRGYVRWPDDIPDTRTLPPDLVMPDEPYTDPHELEIWRLTDLSKEERHERILELRAKRAKRQDNTPRRRRTAG
jgi:biotin operon repressor